jgi:hypothetical protein
MTTRASSLPPRLSPNELLTRAMTPAVVRRILEHGIRQPLASGRAWGLVDVWSLAATCKLMAERVNNAYFALGGFPYHERLHELLALKGMTQQRRNELLALVHAARAVFSGSAVLQAIVYGRLYAPDVATMPVSTWPTTKTMSDIDIFVAGRTGVEVWDSLTNDARNRACRAYWLGTSARFMPHDMYVGLRAIVGAQATRKDVDIQALNGERYDAEVFTSSVFRIDGADVNVIAIATRDPVMGHRTLEDVIVERFDLSVCAVALGACATHAWRLWVAHPSDLIDRVAVINPVGVTERLLPRMRKYAARGFSFVYEGEPVTEERMRAIVNFRDKRRRLRYSLHVHCCWPPATGYNAGPWRGGGVSMNGFHARM